MVPFKPLHETDTDRLEAIRRWHIDQVVSSNTTTVALLNIAIHYDGAVHTKGLCLEPEHARVVIPELQRLIKVFEGEMEKGAA